MKSGRRIGKIYCASMLALLAGCGKASIDNNDLSTNALENGGVQRETFATTNVCGPVPNVGPCYTVTCNTFERTWDVGFQPYGTLCPGGNLCDGAGNCVAPPPPPPISPPPHNLTVFQSSPTEIILQYVCGGNASHEQIRVAFGGIPTNSNWPWSELPNTVLDNCAGGSLSPNYTFSHFEPAHVYCFQVHAWGPQVADVYSDWVCTTGQDDPNPPAAPSGTIDNQQPLTTTLTVTDNALNEDGIRVYLRAIWNGPQDGPPPPNGTDWQLVATFLNPDPANHVAGGYGVPLTYTVSNLMTPTSDLYYQFKLEAYHDHASLSSETILPQFRQRPPVPAVPSNFLIPLVTDNQITLTWDPADYASTYVIALSVNGQPMSTLGATYATTWTHTGLSPMTRHCYMIQSRNRSLQSSAYHFELCATTLASSPRPHTTTITLAPGTSSSGLPTISGIKAPLFNTELEFLELPKDTNVPELYGVILVPNSAVDDALCSLSTPGAVFIGTDGAENRVEPLKALNGGVYPWILTNGLHLQGCAIYKSAPASRGPTNLILHYLGS